MIDATDQELVRMMVAAAASLETLHFGAAASVVRAGAGADDALLQRLPLLLGEVSFRCHDPHSEAVRHAKRLIDQRQYVLRSRWQNVQPRARQQNKFLKAHSWEEYAAWHLGPHRRRGG